MNDAACPTGQPLRWLISKAARGTPSTLSTRLEEEWLAHLESCPSRWSQLRLAVGCCWASAVISKTHADTQPRRVSATAGTATISGSVTFGEPNPRYLSLRPGTLFLIIELQAALLCGLVLHF